MGITPNEPNQALERIDRLLWISEFVGLPLRLNVSERPVRLLANSFTVAQFGSLGHTRFMSKTRAALLAISCLVIGIFVGSRYASHVWSRLSSDLRVASCIRESQMMTIILKKLRAGDTATAIDLVEIDLDSSLFVLGMTVPESPLEPMQRQVLRKVRDYRNEFPRATKSPTSDGVANAFKLADEPSLH